MCQARITLGPSFYFGDPVFSNQWCPRTLFFYALARTLVVVVNSSSFPHLFPLSCGVDVSYETPPSSSVLSILPGQFSLVQVVPDAIQPPPLWSSSPSFPRHLHRHHSLAYVFVFSSQYVPILLQPTFLYFLGYFSHLRCPSNSFIPNSVQLGDSTHPSPKHPHFRYIQLLLLCFLH